MDHYQEDRRLDHLADLQRGVSQGDDGLSHCFPHAETAETVPSHEEKLDDGMAMGQKGMVVCRFPKEIDFDQKEKEPTLPSQMEQSDFLPGSSDHLPFSYVHVETPTIANSKNQDDALSHFIAEGSTVQYPSPVASNTAAVSEQAVLNSKNGLVQTGARKRRTVLVVTCVALIIAAVTVALVVTLPRNASSNDDDDDDDVLGYYTEAGLIEGPTEEGQFGSSISISADGNRLAVGYPGVAGSNLSRSIVQVYELSETGQWVALGPPIEGAATDEIGYLSTEASLLRSPLSVSLSNDGNTLAIGTPFHDNTIFQPNIGLVEVYVYNLASKSWVQLGDSILGEGAEDLFGASVSVSRDGIVVAVGAPNDPAGSNNPGRVQVYQLDDGRWITKGTAIAGGLPGAMFGGSVSLSADGNMLAVGGNVARIENTVSAIVRTFSFTQDWTELGPGILPRDGTRKTQYVAELSSDGTILAISNSNLHSNGDVPDNENISNESLDVRAFTWTEGAWAPLGNPIRENVSDESAGYAVSLSNDGLVIGLGDPRSLESSGGSDGGHAYIYKFNGKGWKQVGPSMTSNNAKDLFGNSVALSGDGSRFATGAPVFGGNDFERGRVHIFDHQV